MSLKLIPAGEFLMGSPTGETDRSDDEGPQHRVQITKAFFMAAHEMTQTQYEQIMGANPSYFSATGSGSSKVSGLTTGRFPVEQVSWFDAVEFNEEGGLASQTSELAASCWVSKSDSVPPNLKSEVPDPCCSTLECSPALRG